MNDLGKIKALTSQIGLSVLPDSWTTSQAAGDTDMSHFFFVHGCHMASTEKAWRRNLLPAVKWSFRFYVDATMNTVVSCKWMKFQAGINKPIYLDAENPYCKCNLMCDGRLQLCGL